MQAAEYCLPLRDVPYMRKMTAPKREILDLLTAVNFCFTGIRSPRLNPAARQLFQPQRQH